MFAPLISICLLYFLELFYFYEKTSFENILTTTVLPPTCSKIESDASKEVLVAHPVVVPDGQLQAPVRKVLHAKLLPGEGLVPPWRRRLPTHPGLLLATTVTRQQISGIILSISLSLIGVVVVCNGGYF